MLVTPMENTRDPAEILELSANRAREQDWTGYAELTHPEALASAKAIFRQVVVADATNSIAKIFFGVSGLEDYDHSSDKEACIALLDEPRTLGARILRGSKERRGTHNWYAL